MELSQFLIDFLTKNNYLYEEILQYNQRKSTYVLKVKQKDKYYLLKAYDENKTPQDIKEKFIIEVEFYKKNKEINSIPKLIYFYENILILEYFESESLRNFLIESKNKEDLLKNLINNIKDFSNKIYRNEKEIVSCNNIIRYISAFCNSHPFQAKEIKISIIDKYLNIIINRLLVKKIKNITALCNNLKIGFSHNDFHYNNVLVVNNNQIKFIDFENVQYEGCFEFDILALIVMIEVYLNEKEKILINDYLNELFNKNKHIKKIYKIYKIAISINKKFYLNSNKKSLNKLNKVLLILKILKGETNV